MGGIGRAVRTAGLAVAGAGAAFTAFSVKSAIDFESSFAGVRKTVVATEEQFAELAAGFRKMAKEIPVNVNELNKIGEAAGQLGIKRKNILQFTRVIADLGATTNLAGDEAASSLARLANITRMPQENFKRLGSTVVALGNNLATTEKEIVAFGLRIAGAGKQVGLTEAQILSIGAALSSVGIEAEAGGTAISTVMIKIAAAVNKGGEAVAGFAQVAGMSSDAFSRKWKTDAAGALVAFIEGLDRTKKAGGDVFGTLDKLGLGGIRVRDALLRASGAGDLLNRSLEIGNKAWLENTALTREAAQRYETTASQIQLLKNRVTDIGISIGQHLLPPINEAIKRFVRFVEAVEKADGLKAKIQIAIEAISGGAQWLTDLLIGKRKEIPKISNVRVLAELEVEPIMNVHQLEAATKKMGLIDKLLIAMNQLDWSAIGRGFAASVARALEVGGTVAGKLTAAFARAVAAVNWVAVGKEISQGMGKALLNFSNEIAPKGQGFWSSVGRALLKPPGVRIIGKLLEDEAQAAGMKYQSGLARGFAGIARTVSTAFAPGLAALNAQKARAGSAGFAVGTAMTSGVQQGIFSRIGAVAAAAASMVGQAIAAAKAAAEASSPSRKTEREVGRPLAEGVIRGWILGSAVLPEKMKQSIRDAVDAARRQVDASRDRLGAAFDGLAARIFRAFDAETAMFRTRSEKLIDEIEQRRQMEDLIRAQADAQARLNQLVAEGAGAGEIAAAQQALTRAGEDIELVQLRAKAAEERTQYESRREEQRLFLEQRLARLTAHFAKEGATVKTALAAITKLMRRFGIDFATAGGEVGIAFVRGLKAAIAKAAGEAGALKGTIEKVAASIKVPGLATGGIVTGPTLALIGERGPEAVVPLGKTTFAPRAADDGLPDRITLDLGDDVIDLVRRGKARFERLNGPGSF